MAIAFVQAASNSSSGTATTVTLTTTTGNLLVVICYQGVNSTSTLSISDTASNTWIQAGGYVTASGDRFGMFYVPGSTSVTSVTATWSGSLSATIPAVVVEFSGVATGTPLDGNASNPATSAATTGATSFTSGSLSTSNANDALIFGVGLGATVTGMTAGSGFTLPSGGTTSNSRATITYRIVSATQSSTTTSDSWSTNISSATKTGIFAAFADTNQRIFTDESIGTTGVNLVQNIEPNISVW